MNIGELYLKRLDYSSRRLALIEKIEGKYYVPSLIILKKVQRLIKKEIVLNNKIIKDVRERKVDEICKYHIVDPIEDFFNNLNILLHTEYLLIAHLDIFKHGLSSIKSLFSKDKSAFIKFQRNLAILVEKEKKLSAKLWMVSEQFPKDCKIREKDFRKSLDLVAKLQEELSKFPHLIGNNKSLNVHGKKVLVLLEKVKKTDLYDFMKKDVAFIKKQVEYMVGHPTENKLAYTLASVYLISPGTFEMTGVFLFFKYLGQYTYKKVKKKKVKKKVKKKTKKKS